LCFEYLTLPELQEVAEVCVEFRDIVTNSGMLWLNLYSNKWRQNQPFLRDYMGLKYHDYLRLCMNRKEDMEYPLSTRSAVKRLEDGTYEIVNNSMLRSFARGSIDSIRGTNALPSLSCAHAVGADVSYFEVALKGCGSVGIASLSDETFKTSYGFGSEEHLGWKGISYGYHGNDGDFVYNDGTNAYGGAWTPYGPSWGGIDAQEDKDATVYTVGCGFSSTLSKIFFTLNGKFIDVAPVDLLKGDYTAAISLHAFGDAARLNVGTVPFLFDVERYLPRFKATFSKP
jgi:hypothetical protein